MNLLPKPPNLIIPVSQSPSSLPTPPPLPIPNSPPSSLPKPPPLPIPNSPSSSLPKPPPLSIPNSPISIPDPPLPLPLPLVISKPTSSVLKSLPPILPSMIKKRLPMPPGNETDKGDKDKVDPPKLKAPEILYVPTVKNDVSLIILHPKPKSKPLPLPPPPSAPREIKTPPPKIKIIEIYHDDTLVDTIKINKWSTVNSVITIGDEKIMKYLNGDEKEFLKFTVNLEDVMDNSQLRNPHNKKKKIFTKIGNEYPSRLTYSKENINYQCVSSHILKKAGYKNLEEWMENPDNIFIGKFGRIKYENSEGRTEFIKVKWGNPYQYDPITKDEEIRLYKLYLLENDLLKDIPELLGKTLGCYCTNSDECHAKVLHDLVLNL